MTPTSVLLESQRASSGLFGLSVTETKLPEEPPDVAGPLGKRIRLEVSPLMKGTKHVQVGNKALFATYFNSIGNGGDYRLSDKPSQAAWGKLVKG